ncbi:AraC family transcriptional regulator [Streptomyces sp. NPDC048290]|uniref:helix-turn-helix transcriptional regulator n=1 Tax=Streptomyces sp. NPDC048290 TaxID=3155811 RepID=UPI003436885C
MYPPSESAVARYVTPPAALRGLGLHCLGAGAQNRRFPLCADRAFGCHALVLVTTGAGLLSAAREHAVQGPAVFLLRKGEWHSYGPDRLGWSERWVLFDGADADVLAGCTLLPRGPVRLSDPLPITRLFDEAVAQCREGHTVASLRAGLTMHHILVALADMNELDPVLAGLARSAFENLPLPEVARRLGLTPDTLRSRVRFAAGVTPAEYVIRLRLTRARRLLADTSMPVRQVAHAVGYADAAYFSRLFARRTGMPPSAFRAGVRGTR